MKPVSYPDYADVLAEALMQQREEDGDKPHAVEGTMFRHSMASFCSRSLGYQVTGHQPTNPVDEAASYRFEVGTAIHDLFQAALKKKYGDACELEVQVQIEEADSSGHIDAVIRGELVDALELKSINGVGYRYAVGACKDGAKGPRHSAVVQAALNAHAIDADRAVVVYLPTENISQKTIDRYRLDPSLAHRAEWWYPRAEYEPIAQAEIQRWRGIADLVNNGELPPRYIPEEQAIVQDPSRGLYTATNGRLKEYWGCNYCSFQDLCVADAHEGE